MPADWLASYEAGWLLFADAVPDDPRWQTSVGNGYVSTVIDSDAVYISGVFNGNETTQSPSHRARVPAAARLQLGGGAQVLATALDMETAVYYRRTLVADADALVEQRSYAHQVYRGLLVVELTLSRCNGSAATALSVPVKWATSLPSSDVELAPAPVPANATYTAVVGATRVAEQPWVPVVTVAAVTTRVPEALQLAVGETQRTWYLVAAYRTSLDSGDPLADALTDYSVAVAMQSALLAEHQRAWRDGVWQSRIDIGGNAPLLRKVRASHYYILSSLRADWPFGLSPGSLSSNAYNGHSFWDTETWMEPSLLMLHPQLARSLIAYRYQRRGAAARFARQLSPAYAGTAFPWETAAAGNNVCPAGYGTCTLEQHISGDVAFTVGQYWSSCLDDDWLLHVGYPTLLGVAEFWASRAVLNASSGQYVIDHVIPPDEYAADVNNSVYTNVVASLSLNLTIAAAARLGLSCPPLWSDIAARLRIPYDPVRDIHLEYDGYTNETVKQADVILLGFPLMYPMPPSLRRNDLDFYLAVTDPGGPAMTWAMFAVGYLELASKQQADQLFARSFLNIHPPFNVWAETASGDGAVNFITGAGGFLQAVINGYFGVRLRLDGAPDALTVCPQLPANSTALSLHGLAYRGHRLRLTVTDRHFFAELLPAQQVAACQLRLRTVAGQLFDLPYKSDVVPDQCSPFAFVCD